MRSRKFVAMRRLPVTLIVIAGLLALLAAVAAAAEGTSPPILEVKTTSHYEPETPREPGKTELDIQATLGWRVTVTVRAHGVTVLSEEQSGTEGFVKQGTELAPGPTGTHATVVFWSCKPPGTVYSYTVTAATEYGEEPSITKTGSFIGATQRQCEKALRISLRQHGEEVRRQQAKARRERGEERARQRRFERNCVRVGGKPVTIETGRGPEIVCRSQTGGIVEA
jgi:hypothetical protein